MENNYTYIEKICPVCKKSFIANPKRKNEIKTYCSRSCVSKSPEIKNKIINSLNKTYKEKYNGVHPSHSELVKNKSKETNLKKYGVDNYGKSKECIDKIKKIKKEKYGNENYNNIEKIKKTCNEKYGVDWYRKSDEHKKKYKETCIRKYGVENISQSDEFRNKYKLLMFKKFTEKKEFINFTPKFSFEEYDNTKTKEYLFECKRCGKQEYHSLRSGKYPRCSCCDKKYSTPQTEIYEFIKELLPTEEIILNDRKAISPQEIDIFLPQKKIGIEFNGLYHHSEIGGGKNRYYHLNKTKKASINGIQLIHIFENEWGNKKEIIKSFLIDLLTPNKNKKKILKTEVKIIDSKLAKEFCKENHIHGSSYCHVNYGLFYKKELVSVISFKKSRYNKKLEWELHRICNKNNYNIPNSEMILFTRFLKDYSPNSIIAYSDRRYYLTSIYSSLGFSFIGNTPPNYYYLIKDDLQSRQCWQKHSLNKKLINFNPMLTEWENMVNHGIDRIWDCGNGKWIFNNKK